MSLIKWLDKSKCCDSNLVSALVGLLAEVSRGEGGGVEGVPLVADLTEHPALVLGPLPGQDLT